MLESAVKETGNYFDPKLHPTADAAAVPGGIAAPAPPAVRPPGRFAGFDTAWQNGAAYARPDSAEPGAPDAPAVAAFAAGHHLLRWTSLSFIVGIGLGVLVYWNGFRVTNVLLRFWPLRWLRLWLYRAMYFDELYDAVFLAVTRMLAAVAGAFDRYVIDALVGGAAWLTRGVSRLIGVADDAVVDGAVAGVAAAAQALGATVRASQTGRVRTYVTVLIAAAALGLAAAVIITLSH
jgi:hypothetical protein